MAETEAVPAPAAAEEAAPAAAEDTKKKPTPGIRLHVKNLSETTTREELSELFKSYGEVLRAEVKKDDDGKCKGMGFVILSTMELAKQAQSEVNGKTLGEKELLVELVEPKAKEGKGKDKGKDRGKDGKGKDGKGKGKDGKDKGKGKVKGKDGKGPPGGFAAVDPYAAYYPQAQAYQAAQMAQMAQMQYLQYAQMAQYQAAYAAQMAQMGGSGLWSPAARAAQMPSAAPQMTPEPLADGGKDKSKGKKGKGKGKAKSERPDQPKSNVAPPSPDKDFVGTLKSISEKNGYGFIECKEAYDSYGRDTWVDHKAIPSAAKVGDTLKFGVTLSEKGHPRAQKVSVA